MMQIEVEPSALKENRWYEYLVRFAFGGAISVAAGVLGHRFGPFVGGLFLAFPALLPASLTLVKEHDGRAKAADDAVGAACGAVGLAAFALVVWGMADAKGIASTLTAATALWAVVSFAVWLVVARQTRR